MVDENSPTVVAVGPSTGVRELYVTVVKTTETASLAKAIFNRLLDSISAEWADWAMKQANTASASKRVSSALTNGTNASLVIVQRDDVTIYTAILTAAQR